MREKKNHRKQKEEPSDGEGRRARQWTDENKDPEIGIGLGMYREKFGQLILRRVIKIVSTRCQILRQKCTKFNFSWDSAPDPAGIDRDT